MSDHETADLLAGSAERILGDLCTSALLRAADADGAAADPLWRGLSDAGLDRALAPESQGGSALGWADVRALVEALGRFAAPVPLAEMLAAQSLARLAGCVLPDGVVTLALAHRAAGGSSASRIVADSVAHAARARWVACTLPSAPGQAATLLVLPVDRAAAQPSAGIGGEGRATLGWSADAAVLRAPLPEGASALVAGAAVRTAQIAGACARVLEMATRYADDRVQFGRPIGKFQAIQQQLALAGEWSAMASMASQLALADPGVALDPERVACAKQVAGTAAQTCADIAHAVHGAIGITAEYDLQFYTRRLWSWAADFGSSLHWAGEIGRAVLAGGEPRVWDEVIRHSSAA